MTNPGPVWDGNTNGPNDMRRAEGKKTTPDATDFAAVVQETILTQKGLTECGEAIQSLRAQLEAKPDIQDVTALTTTLTTKVVAAQKSLGDVAEKAIQASSDQRAELLAAGEMIATLRAQLEAFRATTPSAQDWATLTKGLAAAQESLANTDKATGDAIREFCAQHNELLDGFNSVDDARYWLEQARRMRWHLARIFDQDESERYFVSELESIKDLSREARQGYQHGRQTGYEAGYARGYSEGVKGLPCRLGLEKPL